MAFGKIPSDLKISDAKRPPAEEDAYQMWVRLPNKNQRGTISLLSKQTGIPYVKLKDWEARYEWKKRWVSEIVQSSGAMLEEAAAIITSALPAASDRMIQIINAGADRDAIYAVRALRELLTIIAPDREAHTVNVIDKQLVIQAKDMSREELFSQAQSISQANIDRALASRVSKRQAVPKV